MIYRILRRCNLSNPSCEPSMDLSFNRQQHLSFINKYLSRLDHLISVRATREEILKTGRQLSDTFRKFAAQEELLIEAGATDGKLLEEYQERK